MTNMIIGVLKFFQSLVTNVLPELSIGSDAVASAKSALTTIVEFISVSSFLIPFKTVFMIVGLVYGFRLVKFGVFLVNWVIRRIGDIIP